MSRIVTCTILLLMASAWLGGCVNVQAKAPEGMGSWGTPPPPASVAKASPNSKADLLRENQQLRDRVAWLENQNRKSCKKYSGLEKDKAEIRADMDKIAAERDRYRRQAGR